MPDIPAQNRFASGNQCPDNTESWIDEPRTGIGNKQGGMWSPDRLYNGFPLKHLAYGLHVSSNTVYRDKGLEGTSRGHLVQPHPVEKIYHIYVILDRYCLGFGTFITGDLYIHPLQPVSSSVFTTRKQLLTSVKPITSWTTHHKFKKKKLKISVSFVLAEAFCTFEFCYPLPHPQSSKKNFMG